MPNYQRRIVYLSEAQREELFSEGSITVNGTTITYDANDMYVTPQEEPYVKPASGIPASDLASGVVPDVRINGTSIVSNGVADFPSAGADAFGLVKVGDGGLGVTVNNSGVLRTLQAYTIHAKNGTDSYRPITPEIQHASTFYGLAKAAGDATQSQSDNAVGTYTDAAKTAIRTMLGVPSSSDLNNKVDKSAIENAGITGYTYSTLFGGEFSVTTAASNDYISPYVRASVTGRISKHYMHRVTFNGTEYILSTRLWFNDDASLKVYEYLGNLNLFISDVSGIPGGTDNVPFVIISDLNDSGSIDVLTQTSGIYTIKVEQIVPTKKDLPKTLIYGDNYVPIETKNNGGTYNGFNIGVNELANTRATFAVGYGNQIAHEFGIAVGRRNSLSSETGGGGTAVGTGNTISAAGGMTLGADNVVSGASAVAVGNGLIANTLNTTVLGMYNVPANTTFENFQTNHFYTSGTVVKGTWSSIIPVTFTCVCKADHISGNSSYLYNDVDSQGYAYWEQISSDGDSTLIIGNGTVNERSNAIKIDIKGNCRINGNVYVNCNADSSGGTKLVSQTDYATSTTAGVVKVDNTNGIGIESGNKLYIEYAPSNLIKSGTGSYRPITPPKQHESVFYGLAKAAGDTTQAQSDNAVGTYTDAAKTAIQTMLGIDAVASTKADKNNTVITGSLSMGRLANSTVGENSTAIGYNSTASSVYAFASGYNNVSSGAFSTTVGYNNIAYGKASFSGGMGTGTTSSAEAAFAYGRGISSQGSYMTGFGLYSIVPTLFPEWVSGTSYSVGDRVMNSIYGYECITANSDSTFNTSKWKTLWYNSDTAFVIGNGSGTSSERSNAFKIDIDGNVYLGKDIYVNCNADSTGGTKLESGVSFVETVSGTTPSITGESNTRYMCGEVTSIAITSPSAGTIDVVFTSGSTPAVLTVTPPTGTTMKWPAWFDPTSLATNTTYEINIMDGVYGAVMAW